MCRYENKTINFHTMPEKYENATITSYFGFGFEEDLGREISRLPRSHCFSKSFVLKKVLFKLKRKTDVFKALQFEERFRKGPFWVRIGLTVGKKSCVFKFLQRSVDGALSSPFVIFQLPVFFLERHEGRARDVFWLWTTCYSKWKIMAITKQRN